MRRREGGFKSQIDGFKKMLHPISRLGGGGGKLPLLGLKKLH